MSQSVDYENDSGSGVSWETAEDHQTMAAMQAAQSMSSPDCNIESSVDEEMFFPSQGPSQQLDQQLGHVPEARSAPI